MSYISSILTRKTVVLIFSYSPVGFGHLRVTDSLYHGLSKEITPVLLGSQDESISTIYRFISIHPITRMLMEWTQSGWGEDLFRFLSQYYLRFTSKLLYQQFLTILEQRIDIPDTVIVIATHFGLAHQLSAIKKKLEKERNVRIILVVQVTDDSPQKLWYVPGADLIFAPSAKTAHTLTQYGKKFSTLNSQLSTSILVNPYPLSPLFSQLLSHEEHARRIEQANPESHNDIHIMIPVSGAAVGMTFYSKIIHFLQKHHRFRFNIVVKLAPYTAFFLQELMRFSQIDLSISEHDREVVNMYEKAYAKNIIGFEIVKPSEQAFKALLSPRRVGGAILLFTEAVGRQEFDNLDFLKRHGFLPGKQEMDMLWHWAEKGIENLLAHRSLGEGGKLENCRALMLPKDPEKAARFIFWCLKEKIFLQMMEKDDNNNDDPELGVHGVEEFWRKVTNYVEEREKNF